MWGRGIVIMVMAVSSAGPLCAQDDADRVPMDHDRPSPPTLPAVMHLAAQDGASNHPTWMNASIGIAGLGLAYDLSLNLMHGRYVFALGGWGSSGRELFSLFGQGPWENFSSCNITASRVLSGADEPVLFTVGGGISMSSITSRSAIPGTGGFLAAPELRSNTSRVPGLALLLRFDVPTRSAVGLDIGARADLNGERSMIAIVAGLRIGRIRSTDRPSSHAPKPTAMTNALSPMPPANT